MLGPDDRDTSPEERLWHAAIAQCIDLAADQQLGSWPRSEPRCVAQRRAQEWLFEPDHPGRAFVCGLLSIDEAWLQEVARSRGATPT